MFKVRSLGVRVRVVRVRLLGWSELGYYRARLLGLEWLRL